ncbi:hypothetical protein [Microbacterium maritypicum]
MAVIEIETIEGGRMKWVGIYRDTDSARAVRWGDTLLNGFAHSDEHPEPNLRLLDKAAVDGGVVIGSWQAKGFKS